MDITGETTVPGLLGVLYGLLHRYETFPYRLEYLMLAKTFSINQGFDSTQIAL